MGIKQNPGLKDGIPFLILMVLLLNSFLIYQVGLSLIKVAFDAEGVASYRFGKELCRLKWEEITEVNIAVYSTSKFSVNILYFSNAPLPESGKNKRWERLMGKKEFELSFMTTEAQPWKGRRLIALEYNEKNKAELDRYVAEWKKLRYYMDEKYSDET